MTRACPGRRPGQVVIPPRRRGRMRPSASVIRWAKWVLGPVLPRGVVEVMQRTLILLKPDCVQRRLVGEVIGRFERKGLRLAGLKLVQASRDLAEKHYAVHKGKPFYDSL